MAYPNKVEWEKQPYLVIFLWDQKHWDLFLFHFLTLSSALEANIRENHSGKDPLAGRRKWGRIYGHQLLWFLEIEQWERLQLSAGVGTHGDKFEAPLGDHPWTPRGTYPLFFVENKMMIWYYIVQRRESGCGRVLGKYNGNFPTLIGVRKSCNIL